MRRMLLLFSLIAAMLAVMAVPAFATVHELANSECSADASSGALGKPNPPGLTPGGPDRSEQLATPVVAVFTNPGEADAHALKGNDGPPGFPDFGPHPGTDNCANN